MYLYVCVCACMPLPRSIHVLVCVCACSEAGRGVKRAGYAALSRGPGCVSADKVKNGCGINSTLITQAELIGKCLISQ